MAVNSWSHRLVRPLVRPLVGTRVTPNHITALRAITGAIACLCFAWGSRQPQIWGGVVWIFSALLDRADGELARLGNRISPAGQRFDFVVDLAVNVALFTALGIGLRGEAMGLWAAALGLICSACLCLCLYGSELIESKLEPGAVVLAGAGNFDPDDLFYLIAPLAWAGALNFVLISGGIVLPPIATGIGFWLWRARGRARLVQSDAADRG